MSHSAQLSTALQLPAGAEKQRAPDSSSHLQNGDLLLSSQQAHLPQYSHASSISACVASGGNDYQQALQSDSQTPLLHSPVSGVQQIPLLHGTGQQSESAGHENDPPSLQGSP